MRRPLLLVLLLSAACHGAGGADVAARTDALSGPRHYDYDASGLAGGGTPAPRDGLGRALTRGDLALSWGADGQLAAITDGAGLRTEVIHDEQGRRIAWRRGGQIIAADVEGVRLEPEHVEELVLVASRAVGRLRDGRFELLPLDVRGSGSGEAGGPLAPAAPYGERGARSAFASLVDFAGGFADPALGTVRLGVRDFDPDTQRFIAPDPRYLEDPSLCVASPVECNLYGYARNQPADFVDRSGTGAAPASFGFALHVDWDTMEAIHSEVWEAQRRVEVAGQHLVARYTAATKAGGVNGVLEWRGVDESVLAEFAISSGGKHGGALPPRGDYTVEPHNWDRHDKIGYEDPKGNGWTVAITPEELPDGEAKGRGAFRIHPDGGATGTAGCLGLKAADTAPIRQWFQLHFAERSAARAGAMHLEVDPSGLGSLSKSDRATLFQRKGEARSGE